MSYTKQINKQYYDKLRKMCGEDKLKALFELNRLVWKIAEAGIRNQFPNISEKELKAKLKQRLPYYYQFKSKLDIKQKIQTDDKQ